MDPVPTLDVTLRKDREETLLEIPVPIEIDAIYELARDTYLVESIEGDIMTCIDGALYHNPYKKGVLRVSKVRIVLVERLGMAIKWGYNMRYVAADDRYKFASGVWLTNGQCAVVYSRIYGDVDQWEYSPQQYTLEIIGEGPYKSGPIADIVAYYMRDPDLPPLEYFDDGSGSHAVCFRISASNESIFLFNTSWVFQIRLQRVDCT